MQRMKKAQMLKFLFWIIVALAFFIPACMLGSKLFDLNNPSLKSYTKLVDTIESVGENEVASIAFYLNKKSVVVGFSADMGRFENWKDGGTKSIFTKPVGPNGCAVGKACICLCQGYELEKNTDPKSAKLPCKDLLICHAFYNIDIVQERDVNTDDYVSTGYKWKGGFLVHRGISDSEDVNGLKDNNIDARTFYVQRVKDVVGVCTISTRVTPCVP